MNVSQLPPPPDLASTVRRRREQLRRQIVAGAVSPVDLLREPPDWFGTAVLGDVLCWSGLDELSSVHVLDACGINWGRRMEQLTAREVWRIFETVGRVQPFAWRRWRRSQRREAVVA